MTQYIPFLSAINFRSIAFSLKPMVQMINAFLSRIARNISLPYKKNVRKSETLFQIEKWYSRHLISKIQQFLSES